jgi:hypothetical protein
MHFTCIAMSNPASEKTDLIPLVQVREVVRGLKEDVCT